MITQHTTVKVRKNGQQKTRNLSCNIAANELNGDVARFTIPHQNCLATNRVVNKFESGW